MPVRKNKMVAIKWASKSEFDSMVDSRARRVLNISAKQFINRWKQGRYRTLDSDTCPGVIELAILAPLPRKKRARKNTKRSSGHIRKVSARKSALPK